MDISATIAQELCESIGRELESVVSFVGAGGSVVASTARERIGTTHPAGADIMARRLDERAVSRDEAAKSGGAMREGYAIAIDLDGDRVGALAIAGPTEQARRFARLARHWVVATLRAETAETLMLRAPRIAATIARSVAPSGAQAAFASAARAKRRSPIASVTGASGERSADRRT